ncbi:hypothetical protein BH11ARM2_BH11ARM2_30920 [soil metagenome]
MPKSVNTHEYDHFRAQLVTVRQEAGITQVQLAKRLDKPQSYVSKYERGERRLDVVEFLQVLEAIGIGSPADFLDRLRMGPAEEGA